MVNIYCIRDLKLGYGSIFTAVNDDVAIRTFASAVNDKRTIMYDHPNDFSLYHIGEFKEDDGVINSMSPSFLMSAYTVKEEVD